MPDGNPGRALDRADQEIAAFIEKRAREREEANAEEAARREESEARAAQEREERRLAWLDWHTRQERALEALAAEHREAVGQLLDVAALSSRAGGEGVS